MHILLRRGTQAAGVGTGDRAIGCARVVDIEPVEHAADPLSQRGAIVQRPVALGRGGHRRAQQQDAEVRVAAGSRPAGIDGLLDARAHPRARREQRPGSGMRAVDEVACLHAVAG